MHELWEVGTEDAYKFHLSEAKASRGFGIVMSAGVLALVESFNFAELSRNEHIGVTAFGIAAAALTHYVFDRERKQSIHNAHMDAALATVNAMIDDEPAPEWAVGNSGKILERPMEIGPVRRIP